MRAAPLLTPLTDDPCFAQTYTGLCTCFALAFPPECVFRPTDGHGLTRIILGQHDETDNTDFASRFALAAPIAVFLSHTDDTDFTDFHTRYRLYVHPDGYTRVYDA